MEAVKPTRNEGLEGRRTGPLPQDAPLLSFDDAASYLRVTPAAVRRMVDGRMGSTTPDEIGARLRGWVVRLSPHRRYIRKKPFLDWLSSSGTTAV